MPSLLKSLAEPLNSRSLSSAFRRERLGFLERLLAGAHFHKAPLTILDVGGSESFWKESSLLGRAQITLINLYATPVASSGVTSVIGDARDLRQFESRSFDLVFSNSVIEHVGHWGDQMQMAREIQRVGRHYFVQTPNFWFPVEPHFLVPGFQWMPVSLRSELLHRFDLGHFSRQRDRATAMKTVESVRLLRESQMRNLFPDARIWKERFMGVTKSLVAYRVTHQ